MKQVVRDFVNGMEEIGEKLNNIPMSGKTGYKLGVHLEEEDGEHSDAFNIIENIDRLLQHVQSDKDVPRLILFVPIKCEKYYHENRMDEVDEAIKTQYADLLTAFATGKKARCGLLPISRGLRRGLYLRGYLI